MAFRELLDTHGPRLSPADRAIVDVLLSHPTEAAFLPAEQIAERAGVHVAAATRLAKKLGCTGYPQLRELFRSELLGATDAADRVLRRLDRAEDVLDGLVSDETAALRALPAVVPADLLDAVAGRVLAARRTLLFARGNASVLSSMLARRLRRFGLLVTELPGADRDVAEELISLRPDDLVVALAFRRPPRALSPLLRTAEEVGAHVVLLTDLPATFGAGQGLQVVLAPRGSSAEFQSLTAPMAVANALVLTLARLAGERTTPALQRLDVLLDRFDS